MIRNRHVIGAELSLAAVSMAVVFGFDRLFTGTDWIGPLVLAGAIVHLIAAFSRRLNLGIALQVAVSAIALVAVAAWIFAPETLRFGLPTASTFSTLNNALGEAAQAYPTARAPVVPTDGFVLASLIGVAVVATMADVAAFSLRAPFQALIPPFTLFTLGAVLGSGEHRLLSAALFTVTTLSFVLFVRQADQQRLTWLPGAAEPGGRALLRAGGGLIAVTALAAVIVGPALPGAADEGLWTWRGGDRGPGRREVISPLVDIKARIVNQSRQIAFTVQADRPSYWRLMALDNFDGQSWRISSNFRDVSGRFGGLLGSGPEMEQAFEILALNSEYLPAASQPVAVSTTPGQVTWDDRSSTLLLSERARKGFRYTVRSVLPDFTADQLRQTSDQLATSVTDRYLQLPELDPRVAELATTIAAGHTTNYDQALALQNFFRNEFTYSVDIPNGSGHDEIIEFLFEHRTGYCEQFAASFAAMARTLGIPSRVAVGFTEGDQSRTDPTFFTVRGKHSHAWPEVYFAGVGWVPFEPTPGRFSPGSEEWTALAPEAQPEAGEGTTATSEDEAPAPTLDPDFGENLFPGIDEPGGISGHVERSESTQVPLRAAATVVLVTLGWIVLMRAAITIQHRWRWRRAQQSDQQVRTAWFDVVDAMRRAGGPVPQAAETYREFAQRVPPVGPEGAAPFIELADLAAQAHYSPESLPDEKLVRAQEIARSLSQHWLGTLPRWQRLLRESDPRILWRTEPRRTRQRALVSTA